MLLLTNILKLKKKQIWDELAGTNQRGAERGFFAGTWFGRIWNWRTSGLNYYKIDEFTVYSMFDGCSSEVREKLNKGENDAIVRQMVSNKSGGRR